MTGRTPVAWPRMKIRGRRRRALAAARHTSVFVIPFARVHADRDGSYTFTAIQGYEPGAVRIEQRVTRDGFGRLVK